MQERPEKTVHYGQTKLILDSQRTEHLVLAGVRYGKALAIDTPIPTPSGFVPIGELAPGDTVFDDRGQPCRVTNVSPIYLDHPCYRVVFDDGTQIVADADHLWTTSTSKQRKNRARQMAGSSPWHSRPQCRPKPTVSTHTTEELRQTLRDRLGGCNHSIPVCGAVAWPEADLPLGPYTLGAWLGDGDTGGARITSMDPEILDEIAAEGYRVGPPCGQGHGKAQSYAIGYTGPTGGDPGSRPQNPVLVALRKMGLAGNKRIPEEYLYASADQRLSLLQGLMDTDGSVGTQGLCEFCTILPDIADGVEHLAKSLGIKVRRLTDRAMLRGVDCGPRFRVLFVTDVPVFRLPRKLARQTARPRWSKGNSPTSNRYITAIDPVPSVPVRCIEVDSPSRLYLAGRSFVPTHNSRMGPVWHHYRVKKNAAQGAKTSLVVAPTYKLAEEICLEYYRDYLLSCNLIEGRDGDFYINQSKLVIHFPKLNHKVLTLTGEKPERIVGFTSSHAWIDESALCAEQVRRNVLKRNSFPCDYQQTLHTTTPIGSEHWLFNVFGPHKVPRIEGTPHSMSKSRLVLHGRTHDNPHLTLKYLRMLEDEFSWDSLYYANYILGEWVSLSKDRFYFKFDEAKHVGDFPARFTTPHLYLTFDNNTGHLAWAALQPIGAGVAVVKANECDAENVEVACEQILRAFPPAVWGNHHVTVYGDAVLWHWSNLIKQTGFGLIRKLLEPHFRRLEVRAPRENPLIHDRHVTTNRFFAEDRLMIDRNCAKVILSARTTQTTMDGKVKKDSKDVITHPMEAVDRVLAAIDGPLIRRAAA